MNDLDININLARAMGWKFYSKENPPMKKNVGISVTQGGLFAWDEVQYKWRKFDYRDPVIFVAICKRWKLNIYHRYSEVSYVDDNGTDFSIENNSIEKAAVLCVIDAVKRGVK